ncbi:ABC transporter substrate-binding protein [Mangrovihabitans endophyticus]|nr:ABC transporter substrate-binding protein [Mangrovihabitans endophyticus]
MSLCPARRRAAALLCVPLLAGLAACAGTGEEAADGRITLTVDTFGTFGYRSLIREYEKAHPEVHVVERVRAFDEHHSALTEALDTGTGAGDVVAVEENYVVQFRTRADDFVNLLDLGAGKKKDNWLRWKWDATLTADGSAQIGLGTDVGGLAMCYRPDLFAQAGLPTDRDAVAELWPTWADYIEAGKRFNVAQLPAAWTDSADNLYNQILAQQTYGYYDRDENLIMERDPGVRTAWNTAIQMVDANQSAKYKPFSAQWVAALQGARFATLTCPAWFLGWIQENAPASRAQWDVTTVPGGAGNWGGSWLTVPRQSAHPREAYRLAAWLTAPEQQLRVFRETGNLPSTPQLYDDPAVTGYRSAFFRDAPVGKIYTAAANRKPAQYLGLRNAAARDIVTGMLSKVETGELTPYRAWKQATAQVRALP